MNIIAGSDYLTNFLTLFNKNNKEISNAQRAAIQNTETDFWQQLQKPAHTLFNLFKTNLSFNKKYTKDSHYDYVRL